MNDSQRKAIYEALLGDVSVLAPGELARQALEESAARQLEALEPLIDAMLNDSWKAGIRVGLVFHPVMAAREREGAQ